MYKDDLMKLDLQKVSFAVDARRMLNGARILVSGLYSITGVDWSIALGISFNSTMALRFADLDGLPSNNTMGPVNARSLQDVRLNHNKGNWEDWTACQDIQTGENTPKPCERKDVPEAIESGR